ncbi:MAG TPA: L,D-transpeptidase family protein [Rhizomicrobium sp.]|nr:L,D-transpeptidase family protein [Rhizomicrobium sp.]
MRTLTALSAIYLVSASAFGVAIALQRNPPMAAQANRLAQMAWSATQSGAATINEQAVKPAVARIVEWDKQFFDRLDPPKRYAAAKPHVTVARAKPAHKAKPPVVVAKKEAPPPVLRPAIAEPPAKVAANTPPPKAVTNMPAKPDFSLAPEQAPSVTAPPPRAELSPLSPAELTRVTMRLRDNLTSEMLANFELFLYVSKAESGPWAQRMYVFKKQGENGLSLAYDWPVSTGRELVEYTPSGHRAPSFTPQGYYELDPERMYRHHISGQWGAPMPYAMFFNWQVGGLQTGLAIHAAHGEDIALLGSRASAGCVRLAPENAALLFNLIKTQYRGLAPRFAMERRTATMSNQGLLMHDVQGRIQLAEGFKVLVFIENYGGDNVVAAMF